MISCHSTLIYGGHGGFSPSASHRSVPRSFVLHRRRIMIALLWNWVLQCFTWFSVAGTNVSPVFGLKRDEVTGKWRKLRSEEHNDLYCSPIIMRVIKSGRMGWAGLVARMGGRGESCTGFWWGNPREICNLQDL